MNTTSQLIQEKAISALDQWKTNSKLVKDAEANRSLSIQIFKKKKTFSSHYFNSNRKKQYTPRVYAHITTHPHWLSWPTLVNALFSMTRQISYFPWNMKCITLCTPAPYEGLLESRTPWSQTKSLFHFKVMPRVPVLSFSLHSRHSREHFNGSTEWLVKLTLKPKETEKICFLLWLCWTPWEYTTCCLLLEKLQQMGNKIRCHKVCQLARLASWYSCTVTVFILPTHVPTFTFSRTTMTHNVLLFLENPISDFWPQLLPLLCIWFHTCN